MVIHNLLQKHSVSKFAYLSKSSMSNENDIWIAYTIDDIVVEQYLEDMLHPLWNVQPLFPYKAIGAVQELSDSIKSTRINKKQ